MFDIALPELAIQVISTSDVNSIAGDVSRLSNKYSYLASKMEDVSNIQSLLLISNIAISVMLLVLFALVIIQIIRFNKFSKLYKSEKHLAEIVERIPAEKLEDYLTAIEAMQNISKK